MLVPILFYLVNVVISYFLLRWFYKLSKNDAQYNPHSLLILIMLLPIFNIVVFVGLVILQLITNLDNKNNFNYKKFFRL